MDIKLLNVQIESAKHEIAKKKKELDHFPAIHTRRGKERTVCHQRGCNNAKCMNRTCSNITVCKLKDKHLELQNDICSLQKDLKELKQKNDKAQHENDVF